VTEPTEAESEAELAARRRGLEAAARFARKLQRESRGGAYALAASDIARWCEAAARRLPRRIHG